MIAFSLLFIDGSFQIERANNQMIKQEKLSKALLMVFIDRCLNLPVRISSFHSLENPDLSF